MSSSVWKVAVGGLALAGLLVPPVAGGSTKVEPCKRTEVRAPFTEVRAPAGEWKEVVSKVGGFRILFPTEPKFSKKEMDTGAGRLVNQSYVLEEGPITFVIAWWDFPPEYVRKTGAVRILDGAKEAFFKRFKGKFLKEKIIELGAARGRDSIFETEDDIRLRLKLYLRGNRLVQALVTSEPDLIEGEDANKFFDSLKWE